ncbi:MAG: hypothetical protein ACOYMR_04480 [Ilumatobacteraceae bacterium]
MRRTSVGRFTALGFTFDLDAPAPVHEALAEGLVDLRVPDGWFRYRARPPRLRVRARGDRFDVRLGADAEVLDVDAGDAVAAVLSCCNEAVSRVASVHHLVLHAGVVEVGGVAVALVGHSGTGKTTLTAAAVRRGHGFVADELGVVDDDMVTVAYHRPLGLRPGAVAALGLPASDSPAHRLVRPVAGSALGTLADRVPLALVVLLGGDGEPGVATDVAPARALFELTNLTIGTEHVEPQTFARLDRMVRAVPTVRMARARPDVLLDEIERVVRRVRV